MTGGFGLVAPRRDRHPALDQPVPHHHQRPGHHLKRPRLAAPAAPSARGAHADRHRPFPMSSPATRSNNTSIPTAPLPDDELARRRPEGPVPGHRPTRSTAAIKGTREPRALHLNGLTHTSVSRRRRTTRPFSSPSAAIQDRNRLHLMHHGAIFVVTNPSWRRAWSRSQSNTSSPGAVRSNVDNFRKPRTSPPTDRPRRSLPISP